MGCLFPFFISQLIDLLHLFYVINAIICPYKKNKYHDQAFPLKKIIHLFEDHA